MGLLVVGTTVRLTKDTVISLKGAALFCGDNLQRRLPYDDVSLRKRRTPPAALM